MIGIAAILQYYLTLKEMGTTKIVESKAIQHYSNNYQQKVERLLKLFNVIFNKPDFQDPDLISQ